MQQKCDHGEQRSRIRNKLYENMYTYQIRSVFNVYIQVIIRNKIQSLDIISH